MGAELTAEVESLVRVECRSEGSAEQWPVAVLLGGERWAVRAVLADAVLGAAVAGGAAVRRVAVELADGRRLELERRLPDGPWRPARRR